MRTQTIPTVGAKITATYPWKLRNLKHSVNSGINRVRLNAQSGENLHYKISQKRNGDLMIAVRERGLSNWVQNLSKKNRIQQPLPREEFEHGIMGNEFTPTFLNLKEAFRKAPKKLA